MELADALKILAAARHFDDLDLALRYVGCARSQEEVPDTAAPVADPIGDDAERDDPLAPDDIPSRGPTDGWALLTEAELKEAARDAGGGGGGGDARRRRRRRAGREAHGHRYIIPLLLDPDEDEPESAPDYNSVPPTTSTRAAPPSAAHSAINPRTGKATMHTLFKRPAQSAEIDVEALVRRLSLVLPITDTPRLKRGLAVPPMHLLYDTSLLIGPYADDVRQLVRLARALFDVDVLEVRAYRNTLRGGCGSGPVWTWRPFLFPRRPATVVFISGSFGGDLASRVRELEEVVGELERKGHYARVLWLGDPPSPGRGMRSWRMIRT